MIRLTRLQRLHGSTLNPFTAMRHRLSSLAFSRTLTAPHSLHTPLLSRIPARTRRHDAIRTQTLQMRSFAATSRLSVKLPSKDAGNYENSNARPAADLNNDITEEEKEHFARKLQEDKGKQIRTPWHREGSDVPPVARQRSAGAMTKGMHLAGCFMSQADMNRQAAHHTLAYAQDHPSSHN